MKTLTRVFLGGVLYIAGYYYYVYVHGSINASPSEYVRIDSAWSQSDKDFVKKYSRQIAENIYREKSQQDAFVFCTLKNLEKSMPKGMKSVSTKIRDEAIREAGKGCSIHIYKTMPMWSPGIEQAIKTQLMEIPTLKVFNKKSQDFYCNCFISKLEKLFPKGLNRPIPTDTSQMLSDTCFKELYRNKQSLQ